MRHCDIEQLAGVADRGAATFVEAAMWIDRSRGPVLFARPVTTAR